MKRDEVLRTALVITMGNRNADYGDPVQNHENIAGFWGQYLQVRCLSANNTRNEWLDAEDVAMMMALLKITRAAQRAEQAEDPLATDTFIDAAAYLAIAAECRAARHEEEAEAGKDEDPFFTLHRAVAPAAPADDDDDDDEVYEVD